jgi:hypothetical protein
MRRSSGYLKVGGILEVGEHPLGEQVRLDLGADVDDVTLEVGGVNLGEVDLDEGEVRPGLLLCAENELDGRGIHDITEHGLTGIRAARQPKPP